MAFLSSESLCDLSNDSRFMHAEYKSVSIEYTLLDSLVDFNLPTNVWIFEISGEKKKQKIEQQQQIINRIMYDGIEFSVRTCMQNVRPLIHADNDLTHADNKHWMCIMYV